VFVDTDPFNAQVVGTGVVVQAGVIVDAALSLAVDAGVHLAEIVGSGVFIVALG